MFFLLKQKKLRIFLSCLALFFISTPGETAVSDYSANCKIEATGGGGAPSCLNKRCPIDGYPSYTVVQSGYPDYTADVCELICCLGASAPGTGTAGTGAADAGAGAVTPKQNASALRFPLNATSGTPIKIPANHLLSGTMPSNMTIPSPTISGGTMTPDKLTTSNATISGGTVQASTLKGATPESKSSGFTVNAWSIEGYTGGTSDATNKSGWPHFNWNIGGTAQTATTATATAATGSVIRIYFRTFKGIYYPAENKCVMLGNTRLTESQSDRPGDSTFSYVRAPRSALFSYYPFGSGNKCTDLGPQWYGDYTIGETVKFTIDTWSSYNSALTTECSGYLTIDGSMAGTIQPLGCCMTQFGSLYGIKYSHRKITTDGHQGIDSPCQNVN